MQNLADDKDVFIKSDNGSGGAANYFQADGSTGETKLFHYGSEKISTKSTGIDVTGTATMDGLTVASGSTGLLATYTGSSSARPLKVSNYDGGFSGSAYSINAESAGGEIALQTATKDRIKIGSGGDISFFDDTGSTQGLFWDASTFAIVTGKPPS